jgi:hypothetical protein
MICFFGLLKNTNVKGSRLELSFILIAVSVILLSIIPFHLQLTGATLATNQPNATVSPTPPSTKLFQNSTNSSLMVGDINATNLTQKQELISSHIQQHQPSSIQTPQQLPLQQLPLNQSQPQPLQNQTVLQPEFKPKPRADIQTSNDQLAMMIQLTPHTQNQAMRDNGWYEVSNWQFATSNPSILCPTQNCAFQLEGGLMGPEYTPGEKFLSGKLRINSGMTTQIKDLGISWSAVEERIEAGQRVQAVEGSPTVGNDRTGQENRYQTNGTLTPYGQDLILAIQGSRQ